MSNPLGLLSQNEGFIAYRSIVPREESTLENVASEEKVEASGSAVVHVFQLIIISLIFMTVLSWIEVIFPNDPLLNENITPELHQQYLRVRHHKALVFALSLTGLVFALGIIPRVYLKLPLSVNYSDRKIRII